MRLRNNKKNEELFASNENVEYVKNNITKKGEVPLCASNFLHEACSNFFEKIKYKNT